MSGEESRAADRFDRFLDDLAGGRPSSAAGVEPTVAGAARFSHDLGVWILPDPAFVSRLEGNLMNGPLGHAAPALATVSISRNGRPLPRPGVLPQLAAGRQRRPLVLMTTAAALILVLSLGFGAYRLTRPDGQAEVPAGVSAPVAVQIPPQPTGLFAWHTPRGRILTALDPTTLADLPNAPVLDSSSNVTSWHASADGLTLVSVANGSTERVDRAVITVRDGRTGAVTSEFNPPSVPVYNPRLSLDGTRLVMQTMDFPLGWDVVEVANGQRTASIVTDEHVASGPVNYWLDPSGSVLDVLVCDCSGQGTGPAPAHLVRYDLATGEEVDRLVLDDVLAGLWPIEPSEDSASDLAFLSPGTAASPDGAQLAVVHADGQAVTLVDLEGFRVERTVEVSRPTTFADKILGLLPLAPQSAEAKQVGQGTTRAAVFHPDGRHLYVSGYDKWASPSGSERRRGLGLQLVDLETGELAAEMSADAPFVIVGAAPDGASLYVIGGQSDGAIGGGPLLRRLDARSLAPLAERQFDQWREILLLPIELAG